MRTLDEIVEGVKDGQEATPEELKYALLVYCFLMNMASQSLLRMGQEPNLTIFQKMRCDENHRRYHLALNADPQVYLGTNVPGNPGYEAFRKMGRNLLDAALAGRLPTQKRSE